VWKAPRSTKFIVDQESYDLKNDVPKCECGGNTRPNVTFFGFDLGFDDTETKNQSKKFNKFMSKYDKGDHKIALVEIGAGESVRSIRDMGEFIHNKVKGATLIRINPSDTQVHDDRVVVIKMTAKEAIESLTEQ
jgi:NAD-dependent SIR2 family protein deacetylase